nr:MAG TPA: hypothetical protein [Caudoviricetes sp.]DAK88186.1 MAG TPA: hypothetical protein [Caudoviricetes sp.]DAL32832.1 MAG TPA_asm: hypothetical protein [Bacteriophage sp.]DAT57471.1 MAG TPA: hypothetical protein [Caudoviricetes sp.]
MNNIFAQSFFIDNKAHLPPVLNGNLRIYPGLSSPITSP